MNEEHIKIVFCAGVGDLGEGESSEWWRVPGTVFTSASGRVLSALKNERASPILSSPAGLKCTFSCCSEDTHTCLQTQVIIPQKRSTTVSGDVITLLHLYVKQLNLARCVLSLLTIIKTYWDYSLRYQSIPERSHPTYLSTSFVMQVQQANQIRHSRLLQYKCYTNAETSTSFAFYFCLTTLTELLTKHL